MKRLKEIVLGIVVILVFGWLITFIYRYESSSKNRELAKKMAELSPRGGPPETIEGLKEAIALYESQIERNVREGAQTGVYWKILATRLADKGLDNDALDALERAIHYNSEDPILFYLTGVSAAKIAKSKIGFASDALEGSDHYYRLSENAYLRALELDATYTKAMYGIAVLYSFELERPQEAVNYLERYLQINTSDINAMFVLARSYYMLREYSSAIATYEKIASRTKDRKIKEEAFKNIETVQERMYE